MNITHKKIVLLSLLVSITLFTIHLLIANKHITVRSFEIQSDKIPSSFDSFRIAHISDLHNESFGDNNERLLSKIKETSPDIIALTGDIIDSWKTDFSVAEDFIRSVSEIAPVYYITGNHEPRIDESEELFRAMQEHGVFLLRGTKTALEKGTDKIMLYGIDDPSYVADYLLGDEETVIDDSLRKLQTEDSFGILLSHRPEFFRLYEKYGFDLVLSGHAHGGQFRLPFIGGLFAPGQGILPEYDSGLYTESGTSMIVSRGLGNSTFPLRFNNCPEIITVTLKEAKQ